MDWATIAPILLDVFSELATAPLVATPPAVSPPAYRAQWAGRAGANEFISDAYQHALYLRVTRVVTVGGGDETRYSFAPTAIDPNGLLGVMSATVCGYRKITLQVRSECLQTDDSLWALGVLDRIATRICFDRYVSRLRDETNVAFFDWEDAIDHGNVISEGRELSVATMDMYAYIAINEHDEVPFNWIERVKLSSDINAATDIVDDVIPPLPPSSP